MMNEFAEIRLSEMFTNFTEDDGDKFASICIDTWKTDDDNEEGKVVAEVIITTNIDIVVSFFDNSVRMDERVKEYIQSARIRLIDYALEKIIEKEQE